MNNYVQVGEKKRHLVIPDNYYLVTDGVLKRNDMAANLYEVKWEPIEEEDYKESMPVSIYNFVIRPKPEVYKNS